MQDPALDRFAEYDVAGPHRKPRPDEVADNVADAVVADRDVRGGRIDQDGEGALGGGRRRRRAGRYAGLRAAAVVIVGCGLRLGREHRNDRQRGRQAPHFDGGVKATPNPGRGAYLRLFRVARRSVTAMTHFSFPRIRLDVATLDRAKHHRNSRKPSLELRGRILPDLGTGLQQQKLRGRHSPQISTSLRQHLLTRSKIR